MTAGWTKIKTNEKHVPKRCTYSSRVFHQHVKLLKSGGCFSRLQWHLQQVHQAIWKNEIDARKGCIGQIEHMSTVACMGLCVCVSGARLPAKHWPGRLQQANSSCYLVHSPYLNVSSVHGEKLRWNTISIPSDIISLSQSISSMAAWFRAYSTTLMMLW